MSYELGKLLIKRKHYNKAFFIFKNILKQKPNDLKASIEIFCQKKIIRLSGLCCNNVFIENYDKSKLKYYKKLSTSNSEKVRNGMGNSHLNCFEEIIKKYFLDNSIIALFFKDENQIKVLSKINIRDKKVIKSNSFKNIDLNDYESLRELIDSLKTIYEDFWKENNLINTSIKLPLLIQVNNKDFNLSSKFEKTLNEIDLISNYSISKFNKDFIFYEVIFNGTPTNFINIMNDQNYNFDTQKKTWILK